MPKKKALLPLPKSKFLKVVCPNCGNEQIIFSHAKSVVKCLVCDTVLAEPTGGAAKIKANVIRVMAA